MVRAASGLLISAALIQLVFCSAAGAQEARYATPGSAPVQRFEIATDVKRAFHALWESSAAAGAERVACIGGERGGGVATVSRVLPLDSSDAESMGIAAYGSLDRCGPPEWFGTVHTHIARRDGRRPYPTFSGADRGVMRLWLARWGADGVFCLLYSSTDAHCEAEGESGSLIAGPETHSSY
jgi:hypothetical protein